MDCTEIGKMPNVAQILPELKLLFHMEFWVIQAEQLLKQAVAAASGAASVRVRHIMSRGWDPWTERPLPEGVRVAYPL